MTTPQMTQNQIEYLAWKIMSSALEFIDQDLYLADLHPGGGQYDCLSLISNNSEIILMLNRNGTSAASNSGLVEDIWQDAYRDGARSAAMNILTELDIPMYGELEKEKSDLILSCKRMARWVRHQSGKKGKPVCCWIDDTYSVGPAKNLLTQVKTPESWTTQKPPSLGTDWSAWLFALTVDEKVVGMVNMKTGEAINADGSQMAQWYEEKFSVPVKKIKKFESYSEPIEKPTEEVLKIFRKIGSFNGYKIFGNDLASIANSVMEYWLSTGELPDDIEKVKGALFFEFRRTHHTGHYPDGNDLIFIKALGDAIDKHSLS